MISKPIFLALLLMASLSLSCALTGGPAASGNHEPQATPVHPAPSKIPPYPPPLATAPLPPANQAPTVASIHIFLVALEDQGKSGQAIGCGDSLVPVAFEIEPTSGVLRASLDKLLSLRAQTLGESGLYNALYQSDLRLENIELNNGDATFHLSGALHSGGVCDDPRILGQLTATAMQFSTVKQVHFFVNGKSLEALLSGKE